MKTQDIEDIARCKQARGSHIVRHWLALTLIILGAGCIGLLINALT